MRCLSTTHAQHAGRESRGFEVSLQNDTLNRSRRMWCGPRTHRPPNRWLFLCAVALFGSGVLLSAFATGIPLSLPQTNGNPHRRPLPEWRSNLFISATALLLSASALGSTYFLRVRGFLRRQSTMRFGACLGCGYDCRALGGAGVCPECGRSSDPADTRDMAMKLAIRFPGLARGIDLSFEPRST